MPRNVRALVKPYMRISRMRLSLHDFLFHSYPPFNLPVLPSFAWSTIWRSLACNWKNSSNYTTKHMAEARTLKSRAQALAHETEFILRLSRTRMI